MKKTIFSCHESILLNSKYYKKGDKVDCLLMVKMLLCLTNAIAYFIKTTRRLLQVFYRIDSWRNLRWKLSSHFFLLLRNLKSCVCVNLRQNLLPFFFSNWELYSSHWILADARSNSIRDYHKDLLDWIRWARICQICSGGERFWTLNLFFLSSNFYFLQFPFVR